jgi:GntR family transcriptional regulator / MocR family aminotransferase
MRDVSGGIPPIIPIDRRSGRSLPKQIYDGYRGAILRGDIRPGQQVPSSRDLATELRVSRFPVLDAYAQLLAEGYFESRTGSGTFVSSSLPVRALQPNPRSEPSPDSRRLARRAALLPAIQQTPWRDKWGAFGVHQPAIEHFPFERWSRLVARYSRKSGPDVLHNIDALGAWRFREAICAYLRTSRSVRCEPSQIMIVSGSQQALEITARVLLDPGDPVWVEEPIYQLTRAVLVGSGCRLIPVPVDEEGMNVGEGIRQCHDARVAFVTPSHQYPLGSTMSASRRLQLLHWAQTEGSWIVEDDYDSEYRYETMPISSLQGLDSDSRVIYIGTFSKVLFASIRLGYIVIPPDLVERFSAIRFAMDIFPPYLYQEVLAEFMFEGDFARHIRKMRALYDERRHAMLEGIYKHLGGLAEVHGAEAGMHMTITLPDHLRDTEIAIHAANEKLWLWPLSTSYISRPSRQGFVLGFGSTPIEQIQPAIKTLSRVIHRSFK